MKSSSFIVEVANRSFEFFYSDSEQKEYLDMAIDMLTSEESRQTIDHVRGFIGGLYVSNSISGYNWHIMFNLLNAYYEYLYF